MSSLIMDNIDFGKEMYIRNNLSIIKIHLPRI